MPLVYHFQGENFISLKIFKKSKFGTWLLLFQQLIYKTLFNLQKKKIYS